MAVSVDLSKSLDKDAELLEQAFSIKTVRQLGENKFFAVAAALAAIDAAG